MCEMIEVTHPKDLEGNNNLVLGYCWDRVVKVGYFAIVSYDDREGKWYEDGTFQEENVTHYMPLPEEPIYMTTKRNNG